MNTFSSSGQTIPIFTSFKHPAYKHPDIYVITNRQSDHSQSQFSFTNQVKEDPSLSFFRVNGSLADTLQLNLLDSTAFINEISGLKRRDWVVFVHGDSKTFDEAVIRGLNIQNRYDINVIVFAWPSKDINLHGLKNYFTSYKNVEKSIYHFYSALHTIQEWRSDSTKFKTQNHLSLFLHSLGNYFLCCLGNKINGIDSFPLIFDNTIINAAAVEQKNHKKWVEQLQFQKNIFITSNKQDFNLNGLRFFTNQGKQLGQKIKSPVADNVTYFNFTKSVGFQVPTGYSHTYFLGKMPEKNKNIHQLYYEILHGVIPDLSDENRFEIKSKLFNNVIIK